MTCNTKNLMLLIQEGVQWRSKHHFPTQELTGCTAEGVDGAHGDSGRGIMLGRKEVVRFMYSHQGNVRGGMRPS